MRIATVLAVAIAAGVCLAPAAQAQGFSAVMDGFQVVPPVFTPGSGIGGFSVDDRKMLEYNVSYAGLVGTEIGSNVCGPASPGENGPVIFDLPPGDNKFGTYGPLSAQQESDLNAGLWYVVIRTTAYPDGEIRGQILSAVPVENTTWGAIKGLYGVN